MLRPGSERWATRPSRNRNSLSRPCAPVKPSAVLLAIFNSSRLISAHASVAAGAVLEVRLDPPATAQFTNSELPSSTDTRSTGNPNPSAAVIASIVYMPVPASLPAVDTTARAPAASYSSRTFTVAPIR